MSAFVASGRVADMVLAVTALEFIALTLWRRRTGRGLRASALLSALLPGVGLVLALRAAVVGAWWGWIALCLAAAGVAHVADLRRRWASG